MSLIRSGGYNLLQRISNLLFGIGAFYILVRVFNRDEYGVWALFISLTSVLELVKNGFVKNGLIKFLAGAEGDERIRIKSSAFALSFVISVGSAILLLVLSFFLPKIWGTFEFRDLLIIYITTNFFYMVIYHCQSVQMAYMDFRGPFWATIINKGIFTFIVLYFWLSNSPLSLNVLAICQLITVFFGMIAAIFFSGPYMVFKFKFSRKWAHELFHYGKYTFATTLNAQILKNIDSWMLGAIINPAVVALYNVAIRIANLYDVPSVALAAVLFPHAVQKVHEGGTKEIKRLYEKSVSYLLGVILPFVIVFIILSEPIIILLAGKDYIQAVPVLQITMTYGLLIPFVRQFGVILDALGRVRFNFYFVISLTVMNIILNYFLINSIGLMGAAYATFSSFLVGFIFAQFYMTKKYGVNIGNYPGYILEMYQLIYSKVVTAIR